MPSLASMQRDLQRAIIDADNTIIGSLSDGAKESRAVLLEVYRDGYVLRLAEVIRNDHPMLHAYLGDKGLDEMSRAYIAAHPSRNPNARWFAHAVPEFLRTTEPYADHPQIAELAEIETSLNDAFDAADAPRADRRALAAIAPDAWAAIVLTPHPSTRRLDLATNAFAIWSALQKEGEPPAPECWLSPQPYLVWRADLTPCIRSLSADEADIWDAAAAGASFGRLCELLTEKVGADAAPARAALLLAGWLDAGLITSAAIQNRA